MSATNKDACSSEASCCSAADGPQLPKIVDRSADDAFDAAIRLTQGRLDQWREERDKPNSSPSDFVVVGVLLELRDAIVKLKQIEKDKRSVAEGR